MMAACFMGPALEPPALARRRSSMAAKDAAQLLAVEPGAGGALCCDLGGAGIEAGALALGEAQAVLAQRPAQAFESGTGFLPGRRILSRAAVAWAMTWNLPEVMRALGRCSVTPFMKAWDISMLTPRLVVRLSGERGIQTGQKAAGKPAAA